MARRLGVVMWMRSSDVQCFGAVGSPIINAAEQGEGNGDFLFDCGHRGRRRLSEARRDRH